MVAVSLRLPNPLLRVWTLLRLGILPLWSMCAIGHAQVPTALTPDGTLGTAVSQNSNIYDITGGTRPQNGPNLFHSFDRFSIGTGDTARFSGPTGIENILSRVTGGSNRLSTGGCNRRSLGRICMCSIRVGCSLAPMPLWTLVGRFM